MDVGLILNRAQQKSVTIYSKSLDEEDENGCVCDSTIIDLDKLDAIIETLTWNYSQLSYDDLQQVSNAVNGIGGYSELPYKDLNLAFYNTSVVYQEGGSGVGDWNTLINKPTFFQSTIPLVNGLSNNLNALDVRISTLENAEPEGADFIYDQTDSPTDYAWGNIPIGTVLNGLYVSDIITLATQGVLSPQVTSFSASGTTRQFTAAVSDTSTLSWTVKRRTSPITSIIITDSSGTTYPQTIDATANATENGSWSGTQVVPLNENATNTMTIAVTTADMTSNTANASAQIVYRHYRYWFASTTDLMAASDSDISTFLSNLTNSNREFATNRDMAVKSFTGSPETPLYVYTGYLSSYGNATYVVNAAANNAWTTREFNYLNDLGFTAAFKLNQFNDLVTGTVNIDQN